MSKYEVTVCRSEYRLHVFEVEARDEQGAEKKARACSLDYDWHDSPIRGSDEDVEGVLQIES